MVGITEVVVWITPRTTIRITAKAVTGITLISKKFYMTEAIFKAFEGSPSHWVTRHELSIYVSVYLYIHLNARLRHGDPGVGCVQASPGLARSVLSYTATVVCLLIHWRVEAFWGTVRKKNWKNFPREELTCRNFLDRIHVPLSGWTQYSCG